MAKKVLLKDVATLLNGRAYKQDELLDSGKYPVLRVGNFFSNRGWFYSDLELEDDKYCDNGDLLFAWSASFGPKIWDGGKVIYHYHIWKIITTPQIDKKYFYYYLENAADRIKKSGHGIAMIHTTKGEMEQMELLLPEMEQQIAIGEKFEKISELIALRKRQLALLEQLVKSRFIELFGDPISNPMGWKTKRFDSLCENLDSRRKPITASERETGIYPYYGASGIVDYVADYLFDEDILLVSEDGANLLMRSTPIAFSVSGKVWVNNHAHVVRFEKMSMQKYIEIFFSLIDISEHITGSAQPKLNQAKLNAMTFPVPDDDRLEAFLSFIKQTDKSKLAIRASLAQLELLKKSLMQKYFG